MATNFSSFMSNYNFTRFFVQYVAESVPQMILQVGPPFGQQCAESVPQIMILQVGPPFGQWCAEAAAVLGAGSMSHWESMCPIKHAIYPRSCDHPLPPAIRLVFLHPPFLTLALPPSTHIQTFIYYKLRAEGLIYFRAAKAIYASLAITGINVLKFSFKLWKVRPGTGSRKVDTRVTSIV